MGMAKRNLNYIDLFAGAGGISKGLEGEGFENIFINKNYISDEVEKVLNYNEEWGKKKLKKEDLLKKVTMRI